MDVEAARYLCDQWDEVEQVVHQLMVTDELGYVIITEVNSGAKLDTRVGRVDVPEDDHDTVMYALADGAPPSPADRAEVFLAAIQSELEDHMAGVEEARFRLKFMGIKGGSHLKSKTILLKDSAFDRHAVPEAPLPGVPSERRALDNLQHAGEVRERLDSHDFTRRGQEIALYGLKQVQTMTLEAHKAYKVNTDAVIDGLREENRALRAENRSLVQTHQDLVKARDAELTARINAEADRATLERTLDRAMTTVGDAVQITLAAKHGLDPDTIELLKRLTGNKRLMTALRDPKVQQMLEDEEVQTYVADLLVSGAHTPAIEATPADAPAEAQPATTNVPTSDTSGGDDEVAAELVQPDQAPQVFNHPIPDLPTDFLEQE